MMRALDSAFTTVSTFVEENRGGVKSTVEGLSRASSMLARNRQKLADILQAVPGTVTNFYNIYDPQVPGRPEERRGGKGWVRTWRSGWWGEHTKKKKRKK